jgi:hypothetical protein
VAIKTSKTRDIYEAKGEQAKVHMWQEETIYVFEKEIRSSYHHPTDIRAINILNYQGLYATLKEYPTKEARVPQGITLRIVTSLCLHQPFPQTGMYSV